MRLRMASCWQTLCIEHASIERAKEHAHQSVEFSPTPYTRKIGADAESPLVGAAQVHAMLDTSSTIKNVVHQPEHCHVNNSSHVGKGVCCSYMCSQEVPKQVNLTLN